MDISVIVCTYNRCQSLARTLASLVESALPESVEWEVLVVDNNSSDATREVVTQFAERHPLRFRYAIETRQGKSHALNTGVQAARGAVLAFTDDDVTVEPAWLKNLTEPLYEGRWSVSGGRVLLVWTCPPPSWIPFGEEYDLAPLARIDGGPEAGPTHECPVGCNMAVRRSMFDKYGGFRVDLGPTATSDCSPWLRGGIPLWHGKCPPRTSEDTEFCQRMMHGGEELYYEPAAVVHHYVTGDRLRKEYFLAWWFEKGRGDARQYGARAGTRMYFLRIPIYLVRSLAVWTVRWILAIRSQRRFRNKLTVWGKVGEMLEFYRGTARKDARLNNAARVR